MADKVINPRHYQPEWHDGATLDRAIRSYFVGETLALPCGKSELGHLRADMDTETYPDLLADIERPPFQPDSFDTVYCDPPFDMYHNDQGWVKRLADIARQRLILQTPKCRILPLNGVDKQWVLIEPGPGSTMRWVKSLQVFDFPDWEQWTQTGAATADGDPQPTEG